MFVHSFSSNGEISPIPRRRARVLSTIQKSIDTSPFPLASFSVTVGCHELVTMILQHGSPSSLPYYSKTSFLLFSPVAVLYTVAAHFFLRLTGKRALAESFGHDVVPSLSSSNSHHHHHQQQHHSTDIISIVTGSNTGIGFETARSLAVDHGHTVILACRSREKALAAVEKIRKENGKACFLHPLDLSSTKSIREFTRAVKAKFDTVHVLVNNAGRNTSGETDEGMDLLFQSNFLGHFLLTAELMDAFATGARIVNLASVMHHFAEGEIESKDFWKCCATANTNCNDTYSLSKLAAILFSIELNHRYGDKVRSIAVNPGAVNSDIWRDFPRYLIPLFRTIYLTNIQGCRTSVVAATCDVPNDAIYLQPYWLPRWMAVPIPAIEMLGLFQGHRITQPRLPADQGKRAATALWEACEQLTDTMQLWPVVSARNRK